MELSKKLEEARRQIHGRFPGALVSADTLPSFSGRRDVLSLLSKTLPHEIPATNEDSFPSLTGWPLGRGRSLGLKGQGATALVWQMMGLTMVHFNEAVAYVDGRASFFPPGASLAGVDLRFLFWIHADTVPCAVRAAELLIDSNLFGLVVLDPPSGKAIETGCRRLHLKLLHSGSRLVAIEHDDTIWSLPFHDRLFLKDSAPHWEDNCSSGGISSFKGLGQRATANGKKYMNAHSFNGARRLTDTFLSKGE